MSQSVEVPGVGIIDYPDDYAPDQIVYDLQKRFNFGLQLDEGEELPETSTLGALLRGGAKGVIPSMGAGLGGGVGGLMGLVTGPGAIAAQFGGAMLGSTAAGAVQEEVGEALIPGWEKYAQADIQQHPIATRLGMGAAGLAAFHPASIRELAYIPKFLFKKGLPVERELGRRAFTERAAAGGMGAAAATTLPLIEGRLPTFGDIVEGAAQGVAFRETRKYLGGTGARPLIRPRTPLSPEQKDYVDQYLKKKMDEGGWPYSVTDDTISGEKGDHRIAFTQDDGHIDISRSNLHEALEWYWDPKKSIDEAIDRLVMEEGLHAAALSSQEGRKKLAEFWNDFTALEKKAFLKIIPNAVDEKGVPLPDYQLGAEASRFLKQKAMGMDPSEFLEFSRGMNLRTMEGLIDLVGWTRKNLGHTKASVRQQEWLAKMEENLNAAKVKKGEIDAGGIPSTKVVPELEVRPPVGEETPLRQQGQAAPAQAAAPVEGKKEVLLKTQAPPPVPPAQLSKTAPEVKVVPKPAPVKEAPPAAQPVGAQPAAPATGKASTPGAPTAPGGEPAKRTISAAIPEVKARLSELLGVIRSYRKKSEEPPDEIMREYNELTVHGGKRPVNIPKPTGKPEMKIGPAMAMRKQIAVTRDEIYARASEMVPEKGLDAASLADRDKLISEAADYINSLPPSDREEGFNSFYTITEHLRHVSAENMEKFGTPNVSNLKGGIHFYLNKAWGPVAMKARTAEGEPAQVKSVEPGLIDLSKRKDVGKIAEKYAKEIEASEAVVPAPTKMRYKYPTFEEWRSNLINPLPWQYLGKEMPIEYKNEEYLRMVWNQCIDEFLANASKEKLTQMRRAFGLETKQFKGVLADPDPNSILRSTLKLKEFAEAREVDLDQAIVLLRHKQEREIAEMFGSVPREVTRAFPKAEEAYEALRKRYIASLHGGEKLTEKEEKLVKQTRDKHLKITRSIRERTAKLIGELNRRLHVIPRTPEKDPLRKTLEVDDIATDDARGQAVYRQLTDAEANNQQWLRHYLVQRSGDKGRTTRRVTVVRNRITGEMHAVSTWEDHKKIFLHNPDGVLYSKVDGSAELSQVMGPNEIFATILLRNPVRLFHKRWENQQAYMDDFGTYATSKETIQGKNIWLKFNKGEKSESPEELTPEEKKALEEKLKKSPEAKTKKEQEEAGEEVEKELAEEGEETETTEVGEEAESTKGFGRIEETSDPEELRPRVGLTPTQEERISERMSTHLHGPGEAEAGLLQTELHSLNRAPISGVEADSVFAFFERYKHRIKDIFDIDPLLDLIRWRSEYGGRLKEIIRGVLEGEDYCFISALTKMARQHYRYLMTLSKSKKEYAATRPSEEYNVKDPEARRAYLAMKHQSRREYLEEKQLEAWGLALDDIYETVKEARINGKDIKPDDEGRSGPEQYFRSETIKKYGDQTRAAIEQAAVRLGASIEPSPLGVGTEQQRALYRTGGMIRDVEFPETPPRKGPPPYYHILKPERGEMLTPEERRYVQTEVNKKYPPLFGNILYEQIAQSRRAPENISYKPSGIPPVGYEERVGGERTEQFKKLVRNNLLYEQGYMRKKRAEYENLGIKLGPEPTAAEFGRREAKIKGAEGPAMAMRHAIRKRWLSEAEKNGLVVVEADGEEYVTDPDAMTIAQRVAQGERLVNEEGWIPYEAMVDMESGAIPYPEGDKYFSVLRYQDMKYVEYVDKMRKDHGQGSDEWKEANSQWNEWRKRVQVLQKAWAVQGHAQQGEVDIPTGSFTLNRAMARKYKKSELTADEEQRVSEDADEIANGEEALGEKIDEVTRAVGKADPGEKLDPGQEHLVQKVIDAQQEELRLAREALNRMRSRGPSMAMKSEEAKGEPEPVDPEVWKHLVIDGSNKMLDLSRKGNYSDASWRESMLKEYSDLIGPHLDALQVESELRRNQMIEEQLGTERANMPARKKLTRKLPTIEKCKQVIANAVHADPRGKNISTAEAKYLWAFVRQKYLTSKGKDETWPTYEEILMKSSQELGIPIERIHRGLATNKTIRRVTREMWAQADRNRQVLLQARNWMRGLSYPWIVKFAKSLPRYFFMDKIVGHGFVGQVTHAAPMAFNPWALKTYLQGWMDMYHMVWNKEFHRLKMLEIQNDKDFYFWMKRGLQINPFKLTDDYTVLNINKKLEAFTRGYGFDALKTMRLEQAKKMWKALPLHLQTDAMGDLIAQSVNYMTGTTKIRAPEFANWIFFAPKLEKSRWGFMFKDPIMAIDILRRSMIKDSRITPEQLYWAKSELKQKAAIVGVYYGFLALNQGLLKYFESDQEVNAPFLGKIGDPRRSDFMQFKMAGFKVGFAGPLIGMVRMIADALHIGYGKQTPLGRLEPRQRTLGGRLGEYAIGKLSPISHFGLAAATGQDFMGRPLPWSVDVIPRSKRMRGIRRYRWGEYLSEEFSPIPLEEMFKEVWKSQGMEESTANTLVRALAVAVPAGATGIRVSEDQFAPH